ncbi:MAG: class I adenylate-forming enzyme family protein [bacterium]
MAISPFKEAMEVKARYFPGERRAIVCRGRALTWREVNERTDRLAGALHRLGLAQGETCAFLFFNQPEFLETNLAIQALGAIPVPVNYRYMAAELRYVLENSRTRFFLFNETALPLVQQVAPELPGPLTLVCAGGKALPQDVLSYEELIRSSRPRGYPRADVTAEDTAVIIYTGGTTGQPKGVMLTYENFRANQEAIFSYLLHLLPPVEELELPVHARSELQRKILGLLGRTASPAAALLESGGDRNPVVLLELKSDSSIQIPPLTLTVREGKTKILIGAPPRFDLRLRVQTGAELRKFLELSYMTHTWRGRLEILPKLARLRLSGSIRIEGPRRYRLQMALANFRKPHEQEIQHLALVPPLFHLASYAFWVTFWMYQEGTIYLPGVPEFHPDEVLDLMEAERIAWLFLVPTMWKRLLEALERRPRKIDSLRMALTGAAVMPSKYKKAILASFPNALVVDGFGQTEMAPVTTFKIDADAATVRERSVGRTLEGLEVKIVDEQGEEVPDGEIGELCYRGRTVMKGYFGDESKTREVLTADGWFRSGDLAYRGADGEIYAVERKRECINSGGEKIFPQEVEDVLLSHPAIREACVIGVPDEEWGESVRAVLVLKPDAALTEQEAIDWCRGKIAGYKKPRSAIFVPSLPVSPVGKVLRATVREAHGKPDRSA